jgi:Xaa-Pro aminopeptidase
MGSAGIDALLVGPSADLRYLAGYDAPALERMTLLAVPLDGEPTLVVPELERPRAEASSAGDIARIASWGETEDPLHLVRKALPGRLRRAAVGDRLWAGFVLRLQEAFPGASFTVASEVTAPLRARKDPEEVAALARAAEIADGVALALRETRASGRTERDVARWISGRLLEGGCERVNFAIVASGPNAASPHHEPGDRVLEPGDALVCDFGGLVEGYCSDITRTFVVGRAPDPELAEQYAVLGEAQEAGVRAVGPGVGAEDVDRAARRPIEEAGLGDLFVHRTGHGIGLEEHESPWIVSGNDEPLAPGMAFSVEPGVYAPGRHGARIEDIVVVTDSGVERLNHAPRDLAVVG